MSAIGIFGLQKFEASELIVTRQETRRSVYRRCRRYHCQMGKEKAQTKRGVAQEAMYMPMYRQTVVHGMSSWRKAEDVRAW